MKALIVILLLVVTSIASADQHVSGHYRSNGTYVEPYMRSSPNGTTADNWSTKGNVNPYTGQEGTRTYGSTPPPTYNYNPPSNSYGQPGYQNPYASPYGN